MVKKVEKVEEVKKTLNDSKWWRITRRLLAAGVSLGVAIAAFKATDNPYWLAIQPILLALDKFCREQGWYSI